ncbi:carbonic anhydrase [Hymenobacter terricola]|uniref:carbonic anhydrase n=1 Tax=Hymenobacter terricola TaxID=2819236 RepID=UPI001CF222BC|nr:carbonic anhydrase [Hymenobacter terricola]
MTAINQLLENNRRWSARKTRRDPQYFTRQAACPPPKYFLIGCSDLGVPASQLLGTAPGEVMTHRNVANLVVHSDMSLLSVLQYAVQEFGVEDIIVCGHYGCGGVAAAVSHQQRGLLDSWLTHIRDVVRLHEKELLRIRDEEPRLHRLVELNVIEQVRNLAKTTIIQNALREGQTLRLHGLVYDATTGLVKNLNADAGALAGWASIYETHAAAPLLTHSRGVRGLSAATRLAGPGELGYRRRST